MVPMVGDSGKGSSRVDRPRRSRSVRGKKLWKEIESSAEISERASENKMNSLPRPIICRVCPDLRKLDDEAYNPKFVSIGPLHHGKSEFQPVEKLKLLHLQDLRSRSQWHTLDNCLKKIRGCLSEAREAYSETIKLSDQEFAEMLLVDGCFLVEMIIDRASPVVNTKTFHSLSRAVYGFVWRDLLLLENQIPFFVLNLLFEEIEILYSHLREGCNSENLVSLALRFLGISLPPDKHPMPKKVLHLLHLKHLSMNPGLIDDQPHGRSYAQVAAILEKKLMNLISVPFLFLVYLILLHDPWRLLGTAEKPREASMIPSAKELSEAGVVFMWKGTPLQYQRASQLKVSFRDGTIEIPFFRVDDATNEELRNLVAFEHTCQNVSSHFTDYCMFLCMIIKTADDVAILRKRGILDRLGSDATVAEMFNGLCKEVAFDPRMHYNAELFNDVAAFCEVPHHRWRANLGINYFNSPFTIMILIAGFLLQNSTNPSTFIYLMAGCPILLGFTGLLTFWERH